MAIVDTLWVRLVDVSQELVWLSVFYALLAFFLKRRRALTDGRVARKDLRLNAVYLVVDAMMVAPVLVVLTNFLARGVSDSGLQIVARSLYDPVPVLLTIALALLVSDFVGYWRHRLMHTAALWPAHAIHHSDRNMTWLALARFHPINRLITAVLNAVVLAMLGLPPWAILINGLVRHHYGYFIHADVPWTYGPLRHVFVSPLMHRWHHIRDRQQAGNNFATIFAFFDVAFGTFHVPGKTVGNLGIEEPDFPDDLVRQTVYPFRVWSRSLLRLFRPSGAAQSRFETGD